MRERETTRTELSLSDCGIRAASVNACSIHHTSDNKHRFFADADTMQWLYSSGARGVPATAEESR